MDNHLQKCKLPLNNNGSLLDCRLGLIGSFSVIKVSMAVFSLSVFFRIVSCHSSLNVL